MFEKNLLKVKMPSRYLGNEVNAIHKKWHENKLHVALVFPDLYEIGVSHFGIQILYSILNGRVQTMAERFFAPSDDMESLIRSGDFDLCSLESQKKLRSFDIIGFSLLYELNYTNVINMMAMSEIPLIAKRRGENYPIIIAGGPCTFNPEPVADFFDALVIGDGEEVIVQMAEIWETWIENGNRNKSMLLREWAKIKGIYIPIFFNPSYNKINNSQILTPKYDEYRSVEKAMLTDLTKIPIPQKTIVPFGKAIHDKLRIELSRGCTRGCRFCQAGMIYRPVRERSPQEILEAISKSMKTTGYEDVSLLSLSTGDYSCIVPVIERIIEHGIKNNLSISLPSLRAETLTPEIMNLLKKVRKSGFTIAPEAGSQRLRDVINKNICEEDIVRTVESAFSLGWKTIKLYFMIGLPTECQADLQAIIDLVNKLNEVRKKVSKIGKIKVSVSTFIPKAHTPFQWVKQISLESSKIKIYWLKKNLKIKGVSFKWQDPQVSFVEGILARGDRRLSNLLISAHKEGCKFDGWSDHFNFLNWKKVLDCLMKDEVWYNFDNLNALLPWEHVKTGIDTKFFLKEYNNSILQQKMPDCRHNECLLCGVCDFKLIKPVLHTKVKLEEVKNISQRQKSKTYKRIKIIFSKMGKAKYFGHLEMVKIFHRALRRVNIPLKYSEGFHPLPKMSFSDALSLGIESIHQSMELVINDNFKINILKEKLNKTLPTGLRILKCYSSNNKINIFNLKEQRYIIKLKKSMFSQARLNEFLSKRSQEVTVISRKGVKIKIDLKVAIKEIKINNEKRLELTINTWSAPKLKPSHILDSVFELTEDELDCVRIIKI